MFDENFPYYLIGNISLQIRKQIKNYVFNLFESFYYKYEKFNQKDYLIDYNTRNKKKENKNVITFIFDTKLENLLGNKTQREKKINKEENFLIQCDSNSIILSKSILNLKNNKKKKKKEIEQISLSDKNSGNTETFNNSKTHSNHLNYSNINLNLQNLEKELNGKTTIHIVDNQF